MERTQSYRLSCCPCHRSHLAARRAEGRSAYPARSWPRREAFGQGFFNGSSRNHKGTGDGRVAKFRGQSARASLRITSSGALHIPTITHRGRRILSPTTRSMLTSSSILAFPARVSIFPIVRQPRSTFTAASGQLSTSWRLQGNARRIQMSRPRILCLKPSTGRANCRRKVGAIVRPPHR